MILIDTNVVSEFMRPDVDPAALAWVASIPAHELVISSITIQEIEVDIGRLPDGRRRQRLRAVWDVTAERFSRSVIDFDVRSATAAAAAQCAAQAAGRPMGLADSQIAGTCLAHGLTLATRNTKDFEVLQDLPVVDPFDLPA